MPSISRPPSLVPCLRTGCGATRSTRGPREAKSIFPTLNPYPHHPQPRPHNGLHLPQHYTHSTKDDRKTVSVRGRAGYYTRPGALYATDGNFWKKTTDWSAMHGPLAYHMTARLLVARTRKDKAAHANKHFNNIIFLRHTSVPRVPSMASAPAPERNSVRILRWRIRLLSCSNLCKYIL